MITQGGAGHALPLCYNPFGTETLETERSPLRAEEGGPAPDESYETLYNETIHTFLHLHRYLRQYSRQIRDEGISGRKMSALRFLVETGPKTVGQLSDYHAISDSSASEMVAQLAEFGYVTRTRSEADQRVVLVALTEKGRDLSLSAPLGGIPLLRERLRTLPAVRLADIRDTFISLTELLDFDDGS